MNIQDPSYARAYFDHLMLTIQTHPFPDELFHPKPQTILTLESGAKLVFAAREVDPFKDHDHLGMDEQSWRELMFSQRHTAVESPIEWDKFKYTHTIDLGLGVNVWLDLWLKRPNGQWVVTNALPNLEGAASINKLFDFVADPFLPTAVLVAKLLDIECELNVRLYACRMPADSTDAILFGLHSVPNPNPLFNYHSTNRNKAYVFLVMGDENIRLMEALREARPELGWRVRYY